MSYRRDFSIYRREDVLFQLKIRGASQKFKNQPRPLLRPTSVNFWQYCRNLSHATVPLINVLFSENVGGGGDNLRPEDIYLGNQ
jgi:hypothetical protein